MSGGERRKSPRKDCLFRVAASDHGPPLYVQNISAGGLLATTARWRNPGLLLRLRLPLCEGDEQTELVARVVAFDRAPEGVTLSLAFVGASTGSTRSIEQHCIGDGETQVLDNHQTSG